MYKARKSLTRCPVKNRNMSGYTLPTGTLLVESIDYHPGKPVALAKRGEVISVDADNYQTTIVSHRPFGIITAFQEFPQGQVAPHATFLNRWSLRDFLEQSPFIYLEDRWQCLGCHVFRYLFEDYNPNYTHKPTKFITDARGRRRRVGFCSRTTVLQAQNRRHLFRLEKHGENAIPTHLPSWANSGDELRRKSGNKVLSKLGKPLPPYKEHPAGNCTPCDRRRHHVFWSHLVTGKVDRIPKAFLMGQGVERHLHHVTQQYECWKKFPSSAQVNWGDYIIKVLMPFQKKMQQNDPTFIPDEFAVQELPPDPNPPDSQPLDSNAPRQAPRALVTNWERRTDVEPDTTLVEGNQ